MSYFRTIWNENLGRTQDLTVPEFVHISDGPHWKTIKKPWDKMQKFYKIKDIETKEIVYRTSGEAYIYLKISKQKFYRILNSRNSGLINDRYIVKRIPKFLFILKTGREMAETFQYAISLPRET